MDWSPLRTHRQNLLMIVKFINVQEISKALQHFDIVGIGEWVAKCKIYDVCLLSEQIFEEKFDHVILSEKKGGLSWQP